MLLSLIFFFFLKFDYFFSAVAPVRMAMPMNSLPLLMDFTEDSTAPKTPLTVSPQHLLGKSSYLRAAGIHLRLQINC